MINLPDDLRKKKEKITEKDPYEEMSDEELEKISNEVNKPNKTDKKLKHTVISLETDMDKKMYDLILTKCDGKDEVDKLIHEQMKIHNLNTTLALTNLIEKLDLRKKLFELQDEKGNKMTIPEALSEFRENMEELMKKEEKINDDIEEIEEMEIENEEQDDDIEEIEIIEEKDIKKNEAYKRGKEKLILENEKKKDIIYPITPIIKGYPSNEEIQFQINRYNFVKDSLVDDSDFAKVIYKTKQGKKETKRFLKKSGWRKFIHAFGISIELIEKKVYEDIIGDIKDIHAEVRVRAIAPNGQSVEGIGIKSMSELSKKTRHNLIANAWTRAVNRAVSDLVAFGETSYEEMEDDIYQEKELDMNMEYDEETMEL